MVKQCSVFLFLLWGSGVGMADTSLYSESNKSERQVARYSYISTDFYGPLMGGDTLWGIAHSVRDRSDASINQIMMRIFERNTGAFSKKNINCLKEGQLLLLPGYDDYLNITNSEATKNVKKHYQKWEKMERRCDVRH